MPRGNGRGPNGMGPMTGRGAGYCTGNAFPGYANAGCERGRGLGLGLRRGFGPAERSYVREAPRPAYSPEAERAALALQVESLKRALAGVEARLDELGGPSDKQGN